jgi:epoxide hydrolase
MRLETLMTPFTIAIAQDQIDDLHRRLDDVRWPEAETVDDWSQGAPLAKVRALIDYWRHSYDWRRCEARLNGYPQFKTEIDGLDIHFLHVRSPHANAMPLILTHGWPGSVIEFLEVIGPLTDPVAHGGRAEDAFEVIIPSLPGFGFSEKPTGTGWGVERIAKAWAELMTQLGYDSWVAQGGDWGSMVTHAIGALAPPGCVGIHVNMPMGAPLPEEMQTLTDAEKDGLAGMAFYRDWDSGYSKQQSTRPQTLGYGLTDSPVGQAAWIYEKLYAWTDNAGAPEDALSIDAMLDNIMLYWLPGNAASSARLYWESFAKGGPPKVSLPAGVSQYPREIFRPSRRWVERTLTNIVHWGQMEHGGHFAAWEQPEAFVGELRTCFGRMR